MKLWVRVGAMRRPLWAMGLVAPLAACGGMQSALNAAGPQSARIERLWWYFFWVCAVVFVLVMGALAYALLHRRRVPDGPEAEALQSRRLWRGVAAATLLTALILFSFLLVSVATGRKLWSKARSDALLVEVTGNQWWWQVRYPQAQAVVTANEIHIPVGRQVLLTLKSQDVIHSFWAPNLHGKKDLIPGYQTLSVIQADRAGTYRGQCAEFCGYQHAHMAFIVVAEPEETFHRWLEHQRTPAAAPQTPEQQEGMKAFLSSPCVMCHTVRGTTAAGQVAPDLTHVGSRSTLAAGTLPNTRGHLAGWILDPQSIKPGSRMPANSLDAEKLQGVIAYLESLK
jgi:cytochrome c oxidase subunit 2